mmetsp:Transcript_18597/g.47629  ORF Transcript_18597/g.47629 Transcript_18597/m.47629 type:complete len:210 (-) Transcript_18597:1232-1861(-)
MRPRRSQMWQPRLRWPPLIRLRTRRWRRIRPNLSQGCEMKRQAVCRKHPLPTPTRLLMVRRLRLLRRWPLETRRGMQPLSSHKRQLTRRLSQTRQTTQVAASRQPMTRSMARIWRLLARPVPRRIWSRAQLPRLRPRRRLLRQQSPKKRCRLEPPRSHRRLSTRWLSRPRQTSVPTLRRRRLLPNLLLYRIWRRAYRMARLRLRPLRWR